MSYSVKNHAFLLLSLLTVVLLSACSSGSSDSSDDPQVYYSHTLVFRNSTTLATGYNGYGQLGDDDNENRSTPQAIAGHYDFKGLATGGNHFVAFTNSSTVFSWG